MPNSFEGSLPTAPQFHSEEVMKRAEELAEDLTLEARPGEAVDREPDVSNVETVQTTPPSPQEAPQLPMAEASTETFDIGIQNGESSPVVQATAERLGSSWQQFKEATKNLVRAAYEKIKNTEPVQEALDRFQIHQSGTLATWYEDSIGRSLKRMEKQRKQSTTLQSGMDAYQEMMGQSASLPELQKGIDTARAGEASQRRKIAGNPEQGKVGLVQRYEQYKAEVNEALVRINYRLEKKQAANQKVIDVLRTHAEQLVKEKEKMEAALARKQALSEDLQRQLARAKAKGDAGNVSMLETSIRNTDTDLSRKQDKVGELLRAIQETQARIDRLEKQNTQWEEKKVPPSYDELDRNSSVFNLKRAKNSQESSHPAQATPPQGSAPSAGYRAVS